MRHFTAKYDTFLKYAPATSTWVSIIEKIIENHKKEWFDSDPTQILPQSPKLKKLDQGHLGMSDPLRLDFYPSTPHKTHQTHRPTRPTGPQPDPGPTSSTGPLDQRAHHTKGPIHQGQQHLDPWWETVKKCEKQWEKVKNGDKRWEMVRKNE